PAVHAASAGPTVRALELPSNGTTRHGCHTHGGRRSISAAISTHLRSGDTYDRCAMPTGPAGVYTTRSLVRFASDVATTMPRSDPGFPAIAEKRSVFPSTQRRPAAFGSRSCGFPTLIGTVQVC